MQSHTRNIELLGRVLINSEIGGPLLGATGLNVLSPSLSAFDPDPTSRSSLQAFIRGLRGSDRL
jgi:hypothetical protein